MTKTSIQAHLPPEPPQIRAGEVVTFEMYPGRFYRVEVAHRQDGVDMYRLSSAYADPECTRPFEAGE